MKPGELSKYAMEKAAISVRRMAGLSAVGGTVGLGVAAAHDPEGAASVMRNIHNTPPGKKTILGVIRKKKQVHKPKARVKVKEVNLSGDAYLNSDAFKARKSALQRLGNMGLKQYERGL